MSQDSKLNRQSDTPFKTYSETYFDELYNDNADPWHYQTRWYEKRKRDMCLAVLPQPKYQNAIELGCGNGVFSELLAQRSQALLSIDGNSNAVHLAKQRLTQSSHVKVIQGVIPQALLGLSETLLQACPASDSLSSHPPTQKDQSAENPSHYDLIVISEILYYLSADDIDVVIDWISNHLAVNGTLLCCHWRYDIEGFAITGETVHQRLYQAFDRVNNEVKPQVAYTHQTNLIDSDFLLDVWQNSSHTVAMQENLV